MLRSIWSRGFVSSYVTQCSSICFSIWSQVTTLVGIHPGLVVKDRRDVTGFEGNAAKSWIVCEWTQRICPGRATIVLQPFWIEYFAEINISSRNNVNCRQVG